MANNDGWKLSNNKYTKVPLVQTINSTQPDLEGNIELETGGSVEYVPMSTNATIGNGELNKILVANSTAGITLTLDNGIINNGIITIMYEAGNVTVAPRVGDLVINTASLTSEGNFMVINIYNNKAYIRSTNY